MPRQLSEEEQQRQDIINRRARGEIDHRKASRLLRKLEQTQEAERAEAARPGLLRRVLNFLTP